MHSIMQDRPADALLRAGTLVTQDAARRVLSDAGVAIVDGTVAAVGPWAEFADVRAGEVIDCSADIVLPGLVNAHTHAAMTVFRGLQDDLPLMDWLTGHIWPAEARLSPEIVSLGAALACAEMIASGTTTFCDLYIFERAVAEAAHRAGLRAVLGEGVFDTPNASYKTFEEALARIEELADFTRAKQLVSRCLVAHSTYAASHASLERLRDMARNQGLLLTLHAAESPAETALCLEKYGKRPLAILRDLDLLGPSTLLAHVVDATDAEVALLAERDARVVHCPRSNMKLASGMAPAAALRRAGVTVCLGTDGAASNNGLNLFAEMGAAALLAKVREKDPTALPAQAVLDMATLDGARALGLPGVGSVAPGWQADLIALDGRAPNLQPPHNPVSHLAYAATGREVRLAMVAGRTLYRDGVHAAIDYPALLREMESVRKWARGA